MKPSKRSSNHESTPPRKLWNLSHAVLSFHLPAISDLGWPNVAPLRCNLATEPRLWQNKLFFSWIDLCWVFVIVMKSWLIHYPREKVPHPCIQKVATFRLFWVLINLSSFMFEEGTEGVWHFSLSPRIHYRAPVRIYLEDPGGVSCESVVMENSSIGRQPNAQNRCLITVH